MRTIFALAIAAGLASVAPAFAQEAGSPGAVGTGNGLTGSNPGTDQRDPAAPMVERRATAPDVVTPPSEPVPDTVRGDQNGEGPAK